MVRLGTLLTLIAPVSPGGSDPAAGYLLRAADVADVPALGGLYPRSYPPGVAGADLTDAIADITAAFGGEYGELCLAASPVLIHDGAMIGAIQVVHRAPWPATPDCPFAIELFVAPEWRRRGLARLLLHRSMTALAATGAAQLALRVDAANTPARALYAALGFGEWSG
ncbi:hypothetical protein BH20ACT5_BH20ACT5_06050 [soil metagenome]